MSESNSFADLHLVKKKSDELNETISNTSSKASLRSKRSLHSKGSSKSHVSLGKQTSWASVKSHLSQKDFKTQIDTNHIEGQAHGFCERGIEHKHKEHENVVKQKNTENPKSKVENTDPAYKQEVKSSSNRVAPETHSKSKYNSNSHQSTNSSVELNWHSDPKNRPKILAIGLIVIFAGLIAFDTETTPTPNEPEPTIPQSCYEIIPKSLWGNHINPGTCRPNFNTDSVQALAAVDPTPTQITVSAPINSMFTVLKAKSATISGKGVGGHMASLVHTIYSENFDGVGIINGGPFGYLNSKAEAVMKLGQIYKSVDTAKAFSIEGKIDDIDNMKNDNVYIVHGSYGIGTSAIDGETTEAYYAMLGCLELSCVYNQPAPENGTPAINIKSDIGRALGNDFPLSEGEPLAIFNHLYQETVTPLIFDALNIHTFNSFSLTQYCPNTDCAAAKMDETAYYVAHPNCASGQKKCNVHIYLHDILKSFADVGDEEMENTKYAEITVNDEFIIIFPQTTTEALSSWNYGHTYYDGGKFFANEDATDHLTYKNRQAQTLNNMVDALLKN